MIKGLRKLTDYAGQKIRLHIRYKDDDGNKQVSKNAFNFTVTEATADWINGYDDEGNELHVDDGDIAFIVG